MSKLTNFLGAYDNVTDVWKAYPDGGSKDSYVIISGFVYTWDAATVNWVAYKGDGATKAYNLLDVSGDIALQNDMNIGGTLDVQDDAKVEGDLKVKGRLIADGVEILQKGVYASLAELQAAYPSPKVGMTALVLADGKTFPAYVYVCNSAGTWSKTGGQASLTVDLTKYDASEAITEAIAKNGYIYCGTAGVSTNPLTPDDHNVFYITTESGTYTNFGGLQADYLSVLKWDYQTSTWTADALLAEYVQVNNVIKENTASGKVLTFQSMYIGYGTYDLSVATSVDCTKVVNLYKSGTLVETETITDNVISIANTDDAWDSLQVVLTAEKAWTTTDRSNSEVVVRTSYNMASRDNFQRIIDLQVGLESETKTRAQETTLLGQQLTLENARATSVESLLRTDLDAETSARTTADASLTEQVDKRVAYTDVNDITAAEVKEIFEKTEYSEYTAEESPWDFTYPTTTDIDNLIDA